MLVIFYFLLILIFVSPVYGATFYKWVDKEGVINFTDDYNKVPSEYLDRVQEEVTEDFSEIEPHILPQAFSKKSEAVRTDIYGRDEIWWREHVQPWKERLKEAERDYGETHQKFMEKAMEFSKKRFGSWSKTQFKMNVIELDRLKEEMLRHGEQVAEAKEMLEKLAKEAERSKANPEWLN